MATRKYHQKLLNYRELVYNVIEKSGPVGLTHKEIDQLVKLPHSLRQKILYNLRNNGKIYFSISVAKWKLLKYKSGFEFSSMEWCAG